MPSDMDGDVILPRDVAECGLRADDVGTIVERHVAPDLAEDGRPWRVVVALEFADARRAVEFEKHLKSGSGRAFATRHFR